MVAKANICKASSVPHKLGKLSGGWILGGRPEEQDGILFLICLDAQWLWSCRWQASDFEGIIVIVVTSALFQGHQAFLCLASDW